MQITAGEVPPTAHMIMALVCHNQHGSQDVLPGKIDALLSWVSTPPAFKLDWKLMGNLWFPLISGS